MEQTTNGFDVIDNRKSVKSAKTTKAPNSKNVKPNKKGFNPLQTWGFNTPVSFKPAEEEDRFVSSGVYNSGTTSIELTVRDGKSVNVDLTGLKDETTLVWEEF